MCLRLKPCLYFTLILVAGFGWACVPVQADETKPPNIVFILADDLGWSDTTLYGTTKFYNTPNIERLAKRGMTFTHAYSSSPLCSPTRSSILTGLSPARTGLTAPTCHLPQVLLNAVPGKQAPPNVKAMIPSSATRLDTKYYTLAEMLRDNGYATGHFGKWHLGPEPYSPLEHGFDIDVPHWPGPGPAGSYVAPWSYPDFDPNTPNEHIEDRMADEAVAYIADHQEDTFFLNYWMFSVHAPFDAKKRLIDEYRKKVDPSDPQRSPTYAAMIESMDDAVGRLLDAIDENGLTDNTIIIFASDNGGNMYNEVDGTSATSNVPLRGGKANMYEGGVRGPAIVAYPPMVTPESRSDEVIQSCDFYPTLLEMLAIKAQAGQSFDGVSIVPALTGGELDRNAIFTYFPHSPPIPEWMPAAVSVHQDDWKLIRIFHGGENGGHRYKLFDLSKDIGEKRNLASKESDRVRKMDQLIERFLKDTDAVVPVPNPKFDPARYDASREGKAKLKSTSPKPKPATGPLPKMVQGWQPSRHAGLSVDARGLHFKSTGSDPFASYQLPKSFAGKRFTVKLTIDSKSSGDAQVFWGVAGKNGFAASRALFFQPKHDGKPHEYSLRFESDDPVNAIRVDPSRGPGRVDVSNIRLLGENGEILHSW